jgi:hypothetical protein
VYEHTHGSCCKGSGGGDISEILKKEHEQFNLVQFGKEIDQ